MDNGLAIEMKENSVFNRGKEEMKKFGSAFFIVNALIAYLFAVLIYTDIIPVTKEIVTMLLIVVGSCFLSFSTNVGDD